jgi:hypothetical protein
VRYKAAVGRMRTNVWFHSLTKIAQGASEQTDTLGQYLAGWNAWFRGGLQSINLRSAFLPALESNNTGKARQKKQATGW